MSDKYTNEVKEIGMFITKKRLEFYRKLDDVRKRIIMILDETNDFTMVINSKKYVLSKAEESTYEQSIELCTQILTFMMGDDYQGRKEIENLTNKMKAIETLKEAFKNG